MERLLYRLSRSTHESTFILKGAMLFTVWSGHPHRATKDIDLLGTGEPDLGRLVKIFQDICTVSVEDDGIIFDSTSVTAVRIKEDADYEGVRVQLKGKLGSALLNLQSTLVSVTPSPPLPQRSTFPCCSGHRCPNSGPIHARPSSPRSSKPWCSSGSPTAG